MGLGMLIHLVIRLRLLIIFSELGWTNLFHLGGGYMVGGVCFVWIYWICSIYDDTLLCLSLDIPLRPSLSCLTLGFRTQAYGIFNFFLAVEIDI